MPSPGPILEQATTSAAFSYDQPKASGLVRANAPTVRPGGQTLYYVVGLDLGAQVRKPAPVS